jgi:hypothetical protein
MTIQFNDETFRDDYSFKNSQRAIDRFPFPFHEDSYMYSVNMEQHQSGPADSVLTCMSITSLKCVTGRWF